MAIRNIRRAAAQVGFATPTSAPIRIDTTTNTPFYNGQGSGTTEIEIVDVSSTQTLTGKTITGNINSDTVALAATATTTTNVLANLTGFSWTLVAGKTYLFDIELATTQTTNGGLAVAFNYTTLTLTSIQTFTYQATASDNTTAASSQSTTTTTQTKWVDNKTAAYTRTKIFGTLVVNVGGTLAVQFAQNTTNSDTTSVLLGSYAKFERIN
jgi:hypothetical protein